MDSDKRQVIKMLALAGGVLPCMARVGPAAALTGMFRGNATHTFYGTGTVSDKPKIVWKYQMGAYRSKKSGKLWTGTGWTGTAVLEGDDCFVGSLDSRLYCFERLTGRKKWVFKAQEMFKSSAAYFAGRVYIGNVDNHIYCVNARDGSLLWSYDTLNDCDSSPTISGEKLYIAGESGWMHCFRPDTGHLVWRTFLGGLEGKPGSNGVESSPAVWNGRVYAANYMGDLFCLRESDGAILWRAQTGDDTDVSPVIHEGVLYIAAEEKSPYLFAFDALSGKQLWKFGGYRTNGFWSTPAVVGKRLYIGDFGTRFYCIDTTTGKPVWTKRMKRGVWSSPAVLGGKVVFGGYDSNLYVLNSENGAELGRATLDGRIISSPVVMDGYIYVGTATGMFYCLT